MDILEAEARTRQDGRRDDPRPRLRRPAVPAGRAVNRTIIAHGPSSLDPRRRRARPDVRRPPARPRRRTRRPRRRPPPRRRAARRAPLPRGRRGRRRRRAATHPSPDGPAARAARSRVLRPGADRVGAGRAWSARSSARTSCCKGLAFIGDAISHAAFPGVVVAYIVQGPSYVGAAIAAVGTALAIGFVTRARGHPRGHRDRRAVRRHVRARRVPVQHDRGLRRRPVRLPVRQRLLRSDPRTSSRWRSSAGVVLVAVALLWKELLYATFDPLGAAASGLRVERARVPVPRARRARRSWSASRRSGSSSSSRCWSRRRRRPSC